MVNRLFHGGGIILRINLVDWRGGLLGPLFVTILSRLRNAVRVLRDRIVIAIQLFDRGRVF